MKKFAIVTDSTTYFTDEDFQKYGIKRASLKVICGDKVYNELDIENSKIYELFDEGNKLTTSQPSPGEFLEIYEDLLKEGFEKIFVMTISEPLSGTYQSANLARNMLDEPERVHLFKSKMAAFGNEMQLMKLREYIDQGMEFEEIASRIDKFIDNAGLIMTSEDLTSIIKSGRLSRTKALIGQVLRIKPVICMEKGKLNLHTSARTRKKAISHMLDYMKQKINDDYDKLYIRICSHNSMETTKQAMEEIKNYFKDAIITMSEYIGPVFNVHVGPKGVGISWMME